MIKMIIATDMALHFTDIAQFKARINADDFDPTDADKLTCMSMSIHLSDLNPPNRKWQVSYKWSHMVYDEFFFQGDKERELKIPIGQLNDRYSVNMAKAQVGFMDFIIIPSYELWV